MIVAEDMDRLFRNQTDYHTSRERLLGIQIHTASGKVGKLDGSPRARGSRGTTLGLRIFSAHQRSQPIPFFIVPANSAAVC